MIEKDYDLNDIVEMKKEHPCHKSKYWKIIRMGADIRIKCLGCGTSVLFPRVQFEKKLKTQEQLAEKVSVTRQTINAIEKGDYNPSINLCITICRVLGKTLNDLFWEE